MYLQVICNLCQFLHLYRFLRVLLTLVDFHNGHKYQCKDVQFLSNLKCRLYHPLPFKKSSVIVLHCPVNQAEITVNIIDTITIITINIILIKIMPETRVVADSLCQFWFYLQLTLRALQNIFVSIPIRSLDRFCFAVSFTSGKGREKKIKKGLCLKINTMNTVDFKLQSNSPESNVGSKKALLL